MQQRYEENYHRTEATHWWFLGRRQIVRRLVGRSGVARQSHVLEIGCSAGKLIQELLSDGFARVTGIDVSEPAIKLCKESGLDASLMDAQKLAFADAAFDLITASDVLEHISDHQAALADWYRVLRPGGTLIIFVPAFMWLWTAHDAANQHFRRYRRSQLKSLVREAGFEVLRSSYWNATLFPPVALLRLARRILRRDAQSEDAGVGDMGLPPRALNQVLLRLIMTENQLLLWGVNWPFGVSVMLIARKPA